LSRQNNFDHLVDVSFGLYPSWSSRCFAVVSPAAFAATPSVAIEEDACCQRGAFIWLIHVVMDSNQSFSSIFLNFGPDLCLNIKFVLGAYEHGVGFTNSSSSTVDGWILGKMKIYVLPPWLWTEKWERVVFPVKLSLFLLELCSQLHWTTIVLIFLSTIMVLELRSSPIFIHQWWLVGPSTAVIRRIVDHNGKETTICWKI
jgi:hypothetical protein